MGRSFFQELLANALPQHRDKILVWLTNPKVFNFLKQQVHNAALIYQSEMELLYWQSVMTALRPVLPSLLSKSRAFTRDNFIHWDYTRTEQNIQHRQQLIKNKINQYTTKLNEQMKKHKGTGMKAESMEIINQASSTMIQTGFQNFHTKLEEKLILSKYDAYDVHLVKSFYNMVPNEDQVCIITGGVFRTIFNSSFVIVDS